MGFNAELSLLFKITAGQNNRLRFPPRILKQDLATNQNDLLWSVLLPLTPSLFLSLSLQALEQDTFHCNTNLS